MLDDLIKEARNRRDVFKAIGGAALAGALLADAGFDPAMAQALAPSGKPMNAAFSNAGLQASWCAQGRAKGFKSVVANYPDVKVINEEPADWDVTKVARIWDSILTQNADIAGAFFHNDDMALAANQVMKQKGREGIIIGGVDAMPPAVQAVLDGTMLATVRNPSCRIHGWSVAAGVAAVQGGEKAGTDIPNYILADGPVITKETAPGHLWLQKNFLI